MKTYLTAAEVAKLLSVNRATVTRWIKKGLIHGVIRAQGTQQWHIPIQAYESLLKQYESNQL